MHHYAVRALVLILAVGIACGCTRKNPAVCCISPADCSSLGIQETERQCGQGFVCIDHACTVAPDAPPLPQCEVDTDCSGAMPVCDPTSRECRACAIDDECASSVCDVSSGVCAEETQVLYASPNGSEIAMCTRTAPCSLARAFEHADATRQTVKMLSGTYTASLTMAGKTIIVHGYGATLNAASGAASIHLDDGARLRVFGLTLANINAGAEGTVIDCYPNTEVVTPTVELDQVTIETNYMAVMAYPCTVTITRSRLLSRSTSLPIIYVLPTSSATIDRSVVEGGNAILAEGSGSVVRITNSVIKNPKGGNGAFAGANTFGAGAGSVFVSFSTVINSQVISGSGTPRCAGGTAAGSCIDNTIIYNASPGAPTDTVQAAGVVASYSLVYPQATALTGSNNQLGVNPMFVDFAGGDYHLAAGSPAIDAGDPGATNAVDYDGVMRPQGAHNDLGAFEHRP